MLNRAFIKPEIPPRLLWNPTVSYREGDLAIVPNSVLAKDPAQRDRILQNPDGESVMMFVKSACGEPVKDEEWPWMRVDPCPETIMHNGGTYVREDLVLKRKRTVA